MRNISWALVLLVPSALVVAGCGSSKDSVEKKLSSLRDEVTLLQNEHDRMAERMQALEIKAMQAAPQRAAAAEEPEERVVRPQLRVVKVGPGSEAESADAPAEESAPPAPEPADAKRPVIREYGKPPPPAGRAVPGAWSQNQKPNPRGS
jgi:outer membrane murein-binding lipoprotein Lpp